MRKKHIAALAGIAAVFAVGGSLAYFNQNLEAVNVLNVGKFDTEVVEIFNPEEGENWQPGATVNKQYSVKNSGSIDALVRVKLQETWTRKGEDEPFLSIDSSEEPEILGNNPEADNKIESVFQSDKTDGEAGNDRDDSVVWKELQTDAGDDWAYYKGYYYYEKTLTPGTTTNALLESVTLDKDIDLGEMLFVKKYSTKPGNDLIESDWKEFPLNADGKQMSERELVEFLKENGETAYHLKTEIVVSAEAPGYSDADYNLIITAQSVQPTEEAVRDLFGEDVLFHAKESGWLWEFQEDVVKNQ